MHITSAFGLAVVWVESMAAMKLVSGFLKSIVDVGNVVIAGVFARWFGGKI
jgi:hypothetical protein